jgi:hypothetical protein
VRQVFVFIRLSARINSTNCYWEPLNLEGGVVAQIARQRRAMPIHRVGVKHYNANASAADHEIRREPWC